MYLLPWLLDQQFADEVFADIGDSLKGLAVEIPITPLDVVESLQVVFPSER